MSNNNDTSKLAHATEGRELRDNELEEVSGGYAFSDVMVESVVAPRPQGTPVGLVAPIMPK